MTEPNSTGKAINGPDPVFYFRTNSNFPGIVEAYHATVPTPKPRTTLLKFEQADLCRQQAACVAWIPVLDYRGFVTGFII